ncbi:heme ABC exporter ATP-binding protein CcmA [Devosia sp.]|uniref:heme ABC exporter ATP-binding protein CcmA n=1 Tax=Devosia sp. TaxID=1871048 RepID=UPI0032679502
MTLTVRGLGGQRGDKLLFNALDFSIESGSALALRGPNGAGKTTLLLTLAGMITPTAGTMTLTGAEADGPPLLHSFGHQNAIKPRLSVAENLTFWAAVNGPTGLPVQTALDEVGLGSIAALDAGYLSAGQSRRLALARLLVTARPVWLLDEPMAALDSAGDALVGRLIDQHLDLGGLVIAATHDDLPLRDPARISVLTLGGTS